jgi:hypothetical protein
MNGRDKFLRSIRGTTWFSRWCTEKAHLHKYLRGTWPTVKKGVEPTVINWENLHIGGASRCLRTSIVAVVTIALLVASVGGIVIS